MVENLMQEFMNVFHTTDEQIRAFFAPGRVNLIGEHTDYNGGHVFPCALSIGTYAIAKKRNDDTVRMYSMNFKNLDVITFSIKHLAYEQQHGWANYPKGVMDMFQKHGHKLESGFDVLFYGNIPNGAGLSSSASIELATSVVVNGLFDLGIDMISMVQMSQQAENEFIGVNCGIMDQFAIGMGKEQHAILLDCQTLQYTYSPIAMEGASLVIANTNKQRGLADSKYNERRGECERALKDLQQELTIASLGELSPELFEQYKYLIQNETDRKRAKHAIYENARTKEAVRCLQANDLVGLGQLMKQSHESLRDDYEVTGKELDALAEAAWVQEGTIGSRMTGAGFGGCTISIVQNDKIDSFIEQTGKIYTEQTGLTADFYVVQVGGGARELTFVR
ncbi:galactokinase [Ectobacillus funiculus]|uniref:galactokinase n=1 Tax=Ectobacillus funiculus TaxID=137993 RepID=UPI00101C1149|nr:galactokinase [Ectobacillus funiculus]